VVQSLQLQVQLRYIRLDHHTEEEEEVFHIIFGDEQFDKTSTNVLQIRN